MISENYDKPRENSLCLISPLLDRGRFPGRSTPRREEGKRKGGGTLRLLPPPFIQAISGHFGRSSQSVAPTQSPALP